MIVNGNANEKYTQLVTKFLQIFHILQSGLHEDAYVHGTTRVRKVTEAREMFVRGVIASLSKSKTLEIPTDCLEAARILSRLGFDG